MPEVPAHRDHRFFSHLWAHSVIRNARRYLRWAHRAQCNCAGAAPEQPPRLRAAASHPLLLCACRRETAAWPVAGLLGRQRRRGWLVAASLCGPLRPALKARRVARLAAGLPAGCSDCRAVWLSPPPWRPRTSQQLSASERYPPALLLSFPLSFRRARGRNAWSSAAAHRGSCFAPSSEQTGSRTRGRSSSHAPAALAAHNLWSTHTLLDLFSSPSKP